MSFIIIDWNEWMMNGWWMDGDDEWMMFYTGECSFNLFNIIDEALPDDTDVVDAADASPLATPRPNLSFEVINSTVRFSGPLLKPLRCIGWHQLTLAMNFSEIHQDWETPNWRFSIGFTTFVGHSPLFMFFSHCQVRVVRFIRAVLLLLRLLLHLLLVLLLAVQIAVGTAGPQPRLPDCSGHCRTSTATSRSQRALPDLNRDFQIAVGTAGPQREECEKRCQIECQKICQIECQKECQKESEDMPDRMSEDMPERMSEDMSERMS